MPLKVGDLVADGGRPPEPPDDSDDRDRDVDPVPIDRDDLELLVELAQEHVDDDVERMRILHLAGHDATVDYGVDGALAAIERARELLDGVDDLEVCLGEVGD